MNFLVDLVKALADENRLRIINILNQQQLCVCDIENVLKLTQSNASRHLNKLKNANVIESTKKAQWVYYVLNKTLLTENPWLEELIANHLTHPLFQNDLRNLEEYKKSPHFCSI